MVPFLERPPSEYMRERMWFATQPIEEPDDPSDLVDTIDTIDPAGRGLSSPPTGRTTTSTTRARS